MTRPAGALCWFRPHPWEGRHVDQVAGGSTPILELAAWRAQHSATRDVENMDRRRTEAAVADYCRRHRSRAREELGSFRRETTLRDAVRRAALARQQNGKKYRHQGRIPVAALQEACRRLLAADLEGCADFDELHALVLRLIDPIPFIGELTVYDTALRIGAKLGMSPRTIFLHAGSRSGARALGLNWRAPFLRVGELPEPFRVPDPHEVEDCLCIYKRLFSRAAAA